MKIGIIGSNGFIGKHLSKELSEITGVSLQLFGRSEMSTSESGLNYKQIDLLNSNQLIHDLDEIDLVYYLASDSIPASSWENPFFEIENNLIPFINFLDCSSKAGVKKIVFISSAGTVYGPSNERLSEESDKKPFSPYGITKLTMENYLNYYSQKHNLQHDIFRVSNIYGEGQNTAKGLGVINTFLENILTNNSITVFGNGEQVRNYIYIKDVVQILSCSIQNNISNSNIYNLASDDNLCINDLIALIQNHISKDFTVHYNDSRGSDNPHIYLDNSKIKHTFPDIEFTPIEKGMQQSYHFLKNNPL